MGHKGMFCAGNVAVLEGCFEHWGDRAVCSELPSAVAFSSYGMALAHLEGFLKGEIFN